ncbi:hypothetical protein MNZ22_03220 [Aeromonas encheleia]|jgi:hypothetical protein|uniref:Uncharacterized protein n=1 Tax=Aeromonas encheleia TaxID=73010 RepID=A0AAE9MEW3_9GAMM|nr:hypothetical protein [Aeromonas encheleia]UNP89452.1 hypothetical protein MNZ22_03220 [Aeromonas encheleia]USV56582.1 hypothetical protein NHF51_14650 [Aeromonas encheleia]
MKLAEIAVLSVLGLLIWSEWQEWRLNQHDAIALAYQGVPTVSLWQCGQLRQKMADLTEHSAEMQFQYRGQSLSDVSHYLQREWRQQGCEQLLTQQGY